MKPLLDVTRLTVGYRPGIDILRDVHLDEPHVAAEVGGQFPALFLQDVAEDHLGALGEEAADMGLAHPARTAGDQRHLAVESTHGRNCNRFQFCCVLLAFPAGP